MEYLVITRFEGASGTWDKRTTPRGTARPHRLTALSPHESSRLLLTFSRGQTDPVVRQLTGAFLRTFLAFRSLTLSSFCQNYLPLRLISRCLWQINTTNAAGSRVVCASVSKIDSRRWWQTGAPAFRPNKSATYRRACVSFSVACVPVHPLARQAAPSHLTPFRHSFLPLQLSRHLPTVSPKHASTLRNFRATLLLIPFNRVDRDRTVIAFHLKIKLLIFRLYKFTYNAYKMKVRCMYQTKWCS